MITRNKGVTLLASILLLCINCQVLTAQDSLLAKQDLYNGRIWINRFLSVKGDQFLFSKSFLPGKVASRGKMYQANIRYDAYDDEIQTIAGRFGVLQINKDLVDSFVIHLENRDYRFASVQNDSVPGLYTFYNILLNGNVSLYAAYRKKIDRLSSGGEGAKFYQLNKVYLVRKGVFTQVSNKNELINNLADKEEVLRNFIKKNHLKIRSRDPWSFVPVVNYYNSLTR